MNDSDIAFVLGSLSRLAAARLTVFGVQAHRFLLEPPVSVAEVEAFERRHYCKLPDDYRTFITRAGNGGAGPYYGFFPLGTMDDGFGFTPWRQDDGFVGVLSAPFPHERPWNDLQGAPDPESLSDDDYERDRNAFEERYWSPRHVDGAIPLCHLGCAQRQWLVITGPEAGHIWNDERADDNGLHPLLSPTHQRVNFHDWYLSWLHDCLARLAALPLNTRGSTTLTPQDGTEPPSTEHVLPALKPRRSLWKRLFRRA